MNKTFRNCVVAFFGTMIGTASSIRMFFGDARFVEGQSGGDAWRNFIYDFQTLITGIFAVLAAYLTVRSALRIDRRQHKRHQELMSLTIRSELRTLERALDPQLDQFEKVRKALWGTEWNPYDRSSLENWKWYSKTADEHLGRINKLNQIIERPQFTDALHHFDGRLTRAIFEFKSSSSAVRSNFSDHLDYLEEIVCGYAVSNDYDLFWEEHHEDIVQRAMAFLSDAEALERELFRAKKDYQEMLGKFSHLSPSSVGDV